ncbi:Chorismate synthase [bioreactor metagenome]|uniref:chorismate synthase n=1 Tax=bioreactor metagenome TaxID=1076179 RepID=A0A645BVV5_9ZZZZ
MLRFLTAGESHGPCLTAIIEGLPAGLSLDIDQINEELARRQQGYGRGGRMKIEKDTVDIVSGVRFGQTLGSPITLIIKNRDWGNWQEQMSVMGAEAGEAVTNARPGHADLTGILKYDRQDIRDILERASARETAARVAVGAIMKQFLQAAANIEIASHVINIGGVKFDKPVTFSVINNNRSQETGCVDQETEIAMKEIIDKAKQNGDTLGGVFEISATNLLVGLGSHIQWDRRLDTKLTAALMSIPAIKGVEIGDGFYYANLPGSQAHDEIFYEAQKGYYRKTNHAGGIEGGMSNGEDIIVRAIMKPIPTLMTPLQSVNILTNAAVKANTERSDACAVPAAAVVGEAMTAITLAETLIEKFSSDNMADLLSAIESYNLRINRC